MCCHSNIPVRKRPGNRWPPEVLFGKPKQVDLCKAHDQSLAYRSVQQWAEEYGKGLVDMFNWYTVVEFLEMCSLQDATVAEVGGNAYSYAVAKGVTWDQFAEFNAEQIFSDFEVEEALQNEIAGEAVERDEVVCQVNQEKEK